MNQKNAGVILTYLSELVKILTGLIYTPVMLRLLGQSEYGLYQLVFSVVSYLSLLSMGFAASYMRFYSREKADHNDKGVANLNGMFLLIFISMSVVCILCGAVMVINIRHIFGNGLTDSEYETAKILMILLVINLAMTFPNSIFNCIVTSQERFIFQKSLILAQSILSPFLALPLLIMGYGSIGMVAVTTMLTFAVLVSNIYYCIKKLNAKFSFIGLKFSLLKEMWIFTFFIFLNQIVDQINWSVDKFLLGNLMGTVAVAIYGVGGQINTLYIQCSSAVSNVFVPKVNRLVAEKRDNMELTELFTKVGRIQFIILMLVVCGFVFFGQPFINLWAGDEYREAYYVTLLLIIPVTVPMIQNLGIEIQRAKNKHKTRSVVYFFIAVSNIGISIPLIQVWGPTGAALGTTISLFLGNIIFMNWYYHKHIGLDMLYFWKKIAEFIPALIAPCVFGAIIMYVVTITEIFSLCLYIMLFTAIYITSIVLWGMNGEEKALVFAPFKKLLKNKCYK